jgi:protein-disulfide isomerase
MGFSKRWNRWNPKGALMQLKVPPAPPLKQALEARDHILGADTAKITLVEYGDYQCPHCRAAVGVVDELRNRYGDDLRFAYRHFPLAKIHPQARQAAEAAEAAGAQGKFWEMHGTLFQHTQELQQEHLLHYARDLGLDAERVKRELDDHTYAPRLQEDLSGGVRSGVNATPTFFINGFRHNGGYALDGVVKAIELIRLG